MEEEERTNNSEMAEKEQEIKAEEKIQETEEENLRACNFYRKIFRNNLIEVKMRKTWRTKNKIVWFFKEI